MKHTAFEELLTSVRQAGRIRRGTLKPSRVTGFGQRMSAQSGPSSVRPKHSSLS